MRGIPEERVINIINRIAQDGFTESMLVDWLDEECRELQEPWITLDEFLNYGFEGLCWIEGVNGKLKHCLYRNNVFYDEHHRLPIRCNAITRVMPIYKPELPR